VIAPISAVFLTLQISAQGIPSQTVRRAESVAAFILDRAGISVRWSGSGGYHVQITKSPLHGLSTDAAGFAVLTQGDSSYAAISYPAVEETANSLEADPVTLLGASLAHEVGHLLLGPAHTATGIMRAHFALHDVEMASRGELLFSADQAARLREKLRPKPTSIPSHAEFPQ
jgi:hypothetical protein